MILRRGALACAGRTNLLARTLLRGDSLLGLGRTDMLGCDGRRLRFLRLDMSRSARLHLHGIRTHDSTDGDGRCGFHEHAFTTGTSRLRALRGRPGGRPATRRDNQGRQTSQNSNRKSGRPCGHVPVHFLLLLLSSHRRTRRVNTGAAPWMIFWERPAERSKPTSARHPRRRPASTRRCSRDPGAAGNKRTTRRFCASLQSARRIHGTGCRHPSSASLTRGIYRRAVPFSDSGSEETSGRR